MTEKERIAAQADESELVDAVNKGIEGLGKQDAFKELCSRNSKAAAKLALDLAAGKEASAGLRAAAAVELAKTATDEHVQSLAQLLKDGETVVGKRAAAGLGRIGDAATLNELDAVKVTRSGPLGNALKFAKSLISYRLGLDEHNLSAPSEDELLEVKGDTIASVEFTSAGVSSEDVNEEDVRGEIPAIPVTEKGALKFTCDDSPFLLLFHSDLEASSTFAEMISRKRVVAVLFKMDHCGGGRYVHEYLFADTPQDQVSILIGTRTNGDVVHRGELRLAGDRAKFSLRSANTSLSRAIDFAGEIDGGSLKVTLDRSNVLLGDAPSQQKKRVLVADE